MKWTIILVFWKANFSFFSLTFVKFPFFAHVHVIFQWLQNVGIFGYSRKDITDEDLRSIIESTLTCRVDHQYVADTSLKLWLSLYTLLHSILYCRLCNLVSDFTRKSSSACDNMKCIIWHFHTILRCLLSAEFQNLFSHFVDYSTVVDGFASQSVSCFKSCNKIKKQSRNVFTKNRKY